MKRQIFMLSMALVLVMGAALTAQTTTTTTQPVPPSQQVDQSGQPETGTGMDVDVDAGANAENGVLDADVTATTDSDTSANDQTSALPDEPNQGRNLQNNQQNPVATGTTATGQAVRDVTNTEGDMDADMDRTGTYAGTTDTADMDGSLPQTASDLPLLGLFGLLALAGAFVVRSIR